MHYCQQIVAVLEQKIPDCPAEFVEAVAQDIQRLLKIIFVALVKMLVTIVC